MVTVYTSQGVTIRNTVVQYSVPVVLKRSALTVVWKQTWLVTAEEAEPELKEFKYFFGSGKRMTKTLIRKLCHLI